MGLFNGFYKNYGMTKEQVLEWQALVTGTNIPIVKLTKQQLESGTQMIIDSHDKTIQDCVRLVNNTLTPSVFFDRYDLLIKEMTALIPFEPFYNFKKSISQQVDVLGNNRSKNEKAFINKYYKSTLEAMESLKTQKAKENRIHKFFQIMRSYRDRMSDEAWNYLLQLQNEE